MGHNIYYLITLLWATAYPVLAQNNKEIHLKYSQQAQYLVGNSGQNYFSFFSRKWGFEQLGISFGVYREEFFREISGEVKNYTECTRTNGMYLGYFYPFSPQIKVGLNYGYGQFKKYSMNKPFTEYVFDFDYAHEINLVYEQKFCRDLYLSVGARHVFNNAILSGTGAVVGIVARVPEQSFKIKRSDTTGTRTRLIRPFIGCTRFHGLSTASSSDVRVRWETRDDTQIYDNLMVQDMDDRAQNLIMAGIVHRDHHLLTFNYGQSSGYWFDTQYEPIDYFHGDYFKTKSTCWGIQADLNLFAFFKKTKDLNIFPVLGSWFLSRNILQERRIRDNPDTSSVYYWSMQLNGTGVNYRYGLAYGMGLHLGRFYANFRIPYNLGGCLFAEYTRKSYYYKTDNWSTPVIEKEEGNIKWSWPEGRYFNGSDLEETLFSDLVFTLGFNL